MFTFSPIPRLVQHSQHSNYDGRKAPFKIPFNFLKEVKISCQNFPVSNFNHAGLKECKIVGLAHILKFYNKNIQNDITIQNLKLTKYGYFH